MDAKMDKQYIGDGVYIYFDGYQIWLETLEGDHIALEYAVWQEVVEYGKKVFKIQESETK